MLKALLGLWNVASSRQYAQTGGPLDIREMTCDDLDRVMGIEKHSFTNPWSRRDFLLGLRRPGGFVVVATSGGVLSGYVVGFLEGAEFHLANFAIEPKVRRMGYGGALLGWTLKTMKGKGMKLVSLEARSMNRVAIGLYEKYGFRKVAIWKGYYRFPDDDALVMVKALEEDESFEPCLPGIGAAVDASRARDGSREDV